MNRPASHMPRRPARQSSAVAHSPKEAAIHLVRLEFDCARLRSGIAQAKSRMAGFELELHRNEAERKTLLSLLKSRT